MTDDRDRALATVEDATKVLAELRADRDRLAAVLIPVQPDTDAHMDPMYPKTLNDYLSLLSAYWSDFIPDEYEVPDTYYAAWERQASTVLGPLLAEVQRLAAELADAQRRIALAGGYHERTEREVEIEAALGDLEYDERNPEDHAIAYLLELVDAGRNRVHTVEEANQRLAAVVEMMRHYIQAAVACSGECSFGMRVRGEQLLREVRDAEQAGKEESDG